MPAGLQVTTALVVILYQFRAAAPLRSRPHFSARRFLSVFSARICFALDYRSRQQFNSYVRLYCALLVQICFAILTITIFTVVVIARAIHAFGSPPSSSVIDMLMSICGVNNDLLRLF